MIVTLDTNVYISALNFTGGKPGQLLQLALDGELRVAISVEIVTEVLRVMRQKFHATPEGLHEAEALIAGCTELVTPAQRFDVVKEDPDDDRIIECAVASSSEFIISGDKHLLRLGQYGAIKIVSPAEFLTG